jgi:four helix bundle protein
MENLIIYKKALSLIKEIYDLIKINRNLSNDYSLCDQLKRASVSVITNIAEGYYRSNKQTINYLKISSGSTNEIVELLQIISVIFSINTDKLQKEYKILGRQINSYSNKLQ